MRQHFTLHHRKHTGKLIHHRHTSYWALALLVIASGISTLSIDRMVRADTLGVSATVPAPIPPTAAVFHAKFNSLKTTQSALTITGECPVITPAVIIALYSNSSFLGSSVCQNDGTFSVDALLFEGEQTITAQVVTITGQTGLTSDPIVITYTPPSPPVADSPQTQTPAASLYSGASIHRLAQGGAPFIYIQAAKPFIIYRVGLPATVSFRIDGGTLPYTVTIAWGDGDTMSQTITDSDEHTYQHLFMGDTSSPATVTVTDSVGQQLVRNFAVVNAFPAQDSSLITPASFIDKLSGHPATVPIILYVSLLGAILTLWVYEHSHHRQHVGVPIHYARQHRRRH